MADDPRPPVWLGHVVLGVADLGSSKDYWTRLGLRFVASGAGFCVLELRGGTHLVLLPAEGPVEPGTPAPFDLMVDDSTRRGRRGRGSASRPRRSSAGGSTTPSACATRAATRSR